MNIQNLKKFLETFKFWYSLYIFQQILKQNQNTAQEKNFNFCFNIKIISYIMEKITKHSNLSFKKKVISSKKLFTT